MKKRNIALMFVNDIPKTSFDFEKEMVQKFGFGEGHDHVSALELGFERLNIDEVIFFLLDLGLRSFEIGI